MTTARVLVVDDVGSNLRLLEAKLRAEYFEVLTAQNGEAALELAHAARPDIVLLDVVMPGMDGYEVCQRLKRDPETEHIPIVMITALGDKRAKLKGLEAGADDFLMKPPEDVALFARVRSLVRLKVLVDELRLRDETSRRLGVVKAEESREDVGLGGTIVVFNDDASVASDIASDLGDKHDVRLSSVEGGEPRLDAAVDADLLIVDLRSRAFDPLRLCSLIRSSEDLRQTPILVVCAPQETQKLVRALELGVNDYVHEPIDPSELQLRVRTQLRRKRYADRLRASVQESMEMAVRDQLTGLHNRRYLNQHLEELVNRSRGSGKPLSLIICDIDHFKNLNDTHGHAVGDKVLREFGKRLTSFMRGVDLACRFGGEEFVIVMPDTNIFGATVVAERLRRVIADEPFRASGERELPLTASFGVASALGANANAEQLLIKADAALYRAKERGRNAVVASKY